MGFSDFPSFVNLEKDFLFCLAINVSLYSDKFLLQSLGLICFKIEEKMYNP